jgi:hypothetical protein
MGGFGILSPEIKRWLKSFKASLGMGRGGRRANCGRKRGGASRKSRELADAVAESGATSPLQYLLNVLSDPEASPARKDAAAAASAPYCHPRLGVAPPGTEANGGGVIQSIVIVSVPRGGQYCAETGLIKYEDGLEVSPPPWQPALPSPDIFDELPAPVEPRPEPLPTSASRRSAGVLAEPEPDPKVTPLAAWRRRSGDDA